jgi:hypothetical protein
VAQATALKGRNSTAQGFRPGLYYFGPSGLSIQKFPQVGCRIKSLSEKQAITTLQCRVSFLWKLCGFFSRPKGGGV